MPLYKEWNPNLHSLAAIWHITESEDFFAHQVSVSGNHIRHSKRRIEFLAGRFLLRHLNIDFPLHSILADEHDKPQLPNHELHFSISHSYPYVACMISSESTVGIDIQCWHKNILSLQQKFLSLREQVFCQNDPQKMTLAWTAKEAAYKYQGRRGVDFIEHLPIVKWDENQEYTNIKINLNLFETKPVLTVNSFIFNHFSLSLATNK